MLVIIRNIFCSILFANTGLLLFAKFGKKKIKNEIQLYFSAYVICVSLIAYLTGISPAFGFRTKISLDTVSLIPFDGIKAVTYYGFSGYALANILGNILLFMPIGFFGPKLCPGFNRLYKAVLFGFFLSVSIETFQLFTSRGTDVDDVILNTCGTFLGYIAYIAICKIDKNSENKLSTLFIIAITYMIFVVSFFIGYWY